MHYGQLENSEYTFPGHNENFNSLFHTDRQLIEFHKDLCQCDEDAAECFSRHPFHQDYVKYNKTNC